MFARTRPWCYRRLLSTLMGLLPDTEPADPFYRVGATDLVGEHGDVIRVRPMSGPAGLESAAASELVIYQSTRVSDGAPIAVSGIIALPRGNPPTGGWPVVSWSHGTVGVADRGAPSLDSDELADIGDPTDPPMTVHRKINAAPHGLLNEFLDRGWAVVMTDYEGLGTRGPTLTFLGLRKGAECWTSSEQLVPSTIATVRRDKKQSLAVS